MILGLLLVVSLMALGAGSLRLASLLAPGGLERMLSWAVLLAAAAVLESLALGIFALGGSAAALTAAALLSWLAARLWLPAPEQSLARELRRWWRELPIASRACIGAIAGAALAVGLTLLHRPEPGFDGITYHIPEVVEFVQSGHPGAVFQAFYDLPVGNYPLTNELLLAWLTGISHGFAALTLWSGVAALLLAAAGWLTLRELGVAGAVRALALSALLLGPLLVSALAQPGTDLPALSWLMCCAALCLAARRRPLLLGPAIVAFGLGIGTKTTAGLMGVLVLGFGFWSCRARIRTMAVPLALCGGAAAAVGGVWYVRNLIEHGSPLWPFYAAPWGDPVPPLLKVLSTTMVQRLRYTLLDHLSSYLSATAGSVVLLAGGVLVAGLAARRRPVIAAAVVALGTIAWANAPATGLPAGGVLAGAVGSTVRYLLPVFAAGAVALALAATDGGLPVRVGALTALLGALGWGLQRDLKEGFFLPFSSWLGPGIVAGAALGTLAGPLIGSFPGSVGRLRKRPVAPLIPLVAALCAALAGGLVLAGGSAGFVTRHAKVVTELDAPVLAFLASQPGFGTGRAPVATSPVALGLLAGDRLRHPLSLVGQREPCAEVRARVRHGWVVVGVAYPRTVPGHPGFLFPASGSAQSCLAPLAPVFQDGAYRVYGPRP